jgi:Tat protein secretion system quality control protein TatD with DNase activity
LDITTLDSSFDKEEHYRHLFLPTSVRTTHLDEANSNDDALEIEFRTLLPSLPSPRPLSEVLFEVRENLTAFPNAMLGEVGLDRAFRVPLDYDAVPRVLTSFSIPLEHQLTVLEAQIDLAVELGRNVSLHSVRAQQATLDLLARMKNKHGAKKWNRISVDMHSCGLSPQTWRDVEVGS